MKQNLQLLVPVQILASGDMSVLNSPQSVPLQTVPAPSATAELRKTRGVRKTRGRRKTRVRVFTFHICIADSRTSSLSPRRPRAHVSIPVFPMTIPGGRPYKYLIAISARRFSHFAMLATDALITIHPTQLPGLTTANPPRSSIGRPRPGSQTAPSINRGTPAGPLPPGTLKIPDTNRFGLRRSSTRLDSAPAPRGTYAPSRSAGFLTGLARPNLDLSRSARTPQTPAPGSRSLPRTLWQPSLCRHRTTSAD
jgi:hypothetical protein